MASVAREEINRIIEATDMYALVSPYVKLEKVGQGFKGLCPFHSEKTPSFSVSQEKHLAHCFSCGKGGNPIQFLMDIKHIPFLEALRELAAFNNIKLDLNDPKTRDEVEKQKFYDMNELALKLFTRNLLNTSSGEKALAYLTKRGLSEDDIKTFEIGLAPKEGNILYKLLKESNYLELDMVEAGLITNKGDSYSDFFINRIMFPIKDERGHILGFSGRSYEMNSQAKYMNTPESKVFRKNLILYNLNLAINAISKANDIILHEGYMDVIASYRSNLQEAVCSMGTALTNGQIKQIKRYTKNVTICYDNDNAGIKATLRAAPLLIKEGLNVSCVKLDKAKDSDEFVAKYGKEAYYNYFTRNKVSFIDYAFKEVTNNLDINDISKIEQAKQEFFTYLRLYNSNIIVDKYLKLFASFIQVDAKALENDYYNNRVNAPDNIIPTDIPNIFIEQTPKENVINFKRYEIRIFDYAKSDKNIANKIDNYLEKDNNLIGLNQELQLLWQTLMTYYDDKLEFNEEEFVEVLKETNLYDKYYNMIMINDKYKEKVEEPYNETDLEACLTKISQIARRKKLKNIQDSIYSQKDESLKKELTERKFLMRQSYERK